MSGLLLVLLVVLAVWMIACGYCGYKFRFVWFLIVLGIGLTLNLIWMMVGLKASFGEPHLLMALISAGAYGAGAFGLGLLAGRLMRQLRASAVDSRKV